MTAAVRQKTPPSFCLDCDAAEGQCPHIGARYYASYMDHPEYRPGSGIVPPELKDWFQRPDHSYEKVDPKPRELASIFSGLEDAGYMDARLGRLLREKYELAPLRVSQAATEIQHGFESGRLKNPLGLLSKMLEGIS